MHRDLIDSPAGPAFVAGIVRAQDLNDDEDFRGELAGLWLTLDELVRAGVKVETADDLLQFMNPAEPEVAAYFDRYADEPGVPELRERSRIARAALTRIDDLAERWHLPSGDGPLESGRSALFSTWNRGRRLGAPQQLAFAAGGMSPSIADATIRPSSALPFTYDPIGSTDASYKARRAEVLHEIARSMDMQKAAIDQRVREQWPGWLPGGRRWQVSTIRENGALFHRVHHPTRRPLHRTPLADAVHARTAPRSTYRNTVGRTRQKVNAFIELLRPLGLEATIDA